MSWAQLAGSLGFANTRWAFQRNGALPWRAGQYDRAISHRWGTPQEKGPGWWKGAAG
jgi:hypothetical protein